MLTTAVAIVTRKSGLHDALVHSFLPPPFLPLLGEEQLSKQCLDLGQSQTYHQLVFVSRHPKDMNDIEKRHSHYVGT